MRRTESKARRSLPPHLKYVGRATVIGTEMGVNSVTIERNSYRLQQIKTVGNLVCQMLYGYHANAIWDQEKDSSIARPGAEEFPTVKKFFEKLKYKMNPAHR